MKNFSPIDRDFARHVRASFERQELMGLLGAKLAQISPGEVLIKLPFRQDLTQQDGYIHAGVIACILDNACGYAAMTLQPPNVNILTAEFKVNFLSPAKGKTLIARGQVLKAGKTLAVCSGQAFPEEHSNDQFIAFMLATMVSIPQ